MPVPQSFRTHRKWPWPFFGVLGGAMLAALVGIAGTVLYWGQGNGAGVALGLSAAGAALAVAGANEVARFNALMVQDRLIRDEMRLRLMRLLPPEHAARVHELNVKQLIALRFASDAELPHLTAQVLDGHLADGRAIKLAIKDWQADHMRV